MHHQPCLGVPIKQYKETRQPILNTELYGNVTTWWIPRPYHPIIVRESSRYRVQNGRAFIQITSPNTLRSAQNLSEFKQ